MANSTSQQKLRRWSALSPNDQPLTSFAAPAVQPNHPSAPLAQAGNLNALLVCAEVNVRKRYFNSIQRDEPAGARRSAQGIHCRARRTSALTGA